jgi:hypothetical protein
VWWHSTRILTTEKAALLQPRTTPWDIQLYNTLRVLSNATASNITKAYHRLRSRELHPDKRSHFSNSQLGMIENASAVEANDLDEELERVRQA